MDEMQRPDPTELLVNDLAGRIAQVSIEAASWKTRALLAENALAEIKAEEEDGEAE